VSKTAEGADADQGVIDLESNWSLPKIGSANDPVILTLVGASFRTPKGVERSLRYSVAVPDGDYEKALATIRNVGGVYFPKADKSGRHWFLPWPPAAVLVAPAKKRPQTTN
jgi:hypothetical protein